MAGWQWLKDLALPQDAEVPTYRLSEVAQQAPLDDLARYQDVLAQRPVEGVNVHPEMQSEARGGPSWIREQTIEPLEFGSLGDPVSQLAFLGAPGVLRGTKSLLEIAATPGPRLGGMLRGEGGNLGPVPRGPGGEPLPESVLRGPEGQLERYYHGTKRGYPDFDVSQYGSGAGGDLYGPGVYMTQSPKIASEYAAGNQFEVFTTEAAAQHFAREMGTEVIPMRLGGSANYWKVPLVQEGANVRGVYPDLKKPFDIEGQIPDAVAKQLLAETPKGPPEWLDQTMATARQRRAGGNTAAGGDPGSAEPGALTGKEVYEWLVQQSYGDKDVVRQLLQKYGYDGITHLGGTVTGGQPHQVAIAFAPEHVYPAPHVEAIVQRRSQSGGYQRRRE